MGEYLNSLSEMGPLYEAQPNVRFASTFLSNDYRKYAIEGETLQDKDTGEVFVKDKYGRVLSNTQNRMSTEDELLRLTMLLRSNPNFRRPTPEPNDKMDSAYLNTQIDIMALFDNKKFDMSQNDWIYKKDGKINKDSDFLAFTISAESNGFFIELRTPDIYKNNVLSYVSDYDRLSEIIDSDEYSNTFDKLKNICGKSEKLSLTKYTNPKWKDNHAAINYSVFSCNNIVHETDIDYSHEFTFTDFIRMNEVNCVCIPEEAINKLKSQISLHDGAFFVVINWIGFHKFNNIRKYIGNNGLKYNMWTRDFSNYTLKLYSDTYTVDPLPLEYISIGRFIDVIRPKDTNLKVNILNTSIMSKKFISDIDNMLNGTTDYYTLNYEQIISFIKNNKLTSYLKNVTKMALPTSESIITSKNQPSDDIYTIGKVWAEPISASFHAGKYNLTPTNLDEQSKQFGVLELLLSEYKDPMNANISMDAHRHEFYIGDRPLYLLNNNSAGGEKW